MKGLVSIIFTIVAVNLPPLASAQENKNCGTIAHGTAIADVHKCAAFLLCNNGVLVSTTCPENYGYNSASKKCEYNPRCWTSTTTTPTPPTNQNPCAGRPSGLFLPSPLSCRQFYYCSDGKANLRSCPNGYAYSSLDSVCIIRANNAPCF